MIKIAPSILSADFGNMKKDIENIKLWGAEIVHCDVMDGVFVPNLTFGMPMVKAVRKATDLIVDTHLMIVEPEKYALQFVAAGADVVTFHPEASKDPEKLLKDLKAVGAKCGIALNPDVPFQPYAHLVHLCDVILIMSVFAGFGGQKMIPECLDKLKLVKTYLIENKIDAVLEIDGGITEENAQLVRDFGADWIVAGSAVFCSKNPAETILKIRG